MSDNNKYDGGSYNEMKCIWMASNVVDYKLCDRNFDCENCPFDRVMRNIPADSMEDVSEEKSIIDTNDIIDLNVDKLKAEAFNEKYIYIKNHLILKHLFSNTYYLGICPALMSILDNITSINSSDNSNYVLKEQALLNIEGEWGMTSILAPMDFLILEKMNLTPLGIITNKWFAIIVINQSDLEEARVDYDEWEKRQNELISNLENYRIKQPGVGVTLLDGGKKIQYLYQVMGKNDYKNLLNNLFKY